MSETKRSKFNCPCCKNPLLVLPAEGGTVALYCAVGRCSSAACNDLSFGKTEQEAYDQKRADWRDEE
jgi:hypothetical protein